MPGICPTIDELAAVLTADPDRARTIDVHLRECAACREKLDILAGGAASWLKLAQSIQVDPPSDRLREALEGLKRDGHSKPKLTAQSTLRLHYLGDYEILEEIGRGGMGVVYRARQLSLQREVAVKVILAGQHASGVEVRRFHVEAEAAAKLDHPNIIPIYEIGEHDGHHFFSMKLAEGGSLAEAISSRLRASAASTGGAMGASTSWPAKSACSLVATVARAVHYAHQRGVLHRDLKPGNILFDRAGAPHVTDFGLAKLIEHDSSLTRSAAIMGSPNYMAPEQAAGHTHDATIAVDVYSLGAIFYEMLTGRPPFKADSTAKTIHLVLAADPVSPAEVSPGIARDLATICLKCLEKDPVKRYGNAEQLADDLDRFRRGEPIHARPVGWAGRAWRWSKREPAVAGALAALVLVFVLGFCGVLWKWRGEIRQRERAQTAITRLEFERADSLLQADDAARGLAYLARLLRQQPNNRVVAERLMSALTYRSFCLPVAPLAHGESLPPLSAQDRSGPSGDWKANSLVTASFSGDGERLVTAARDGIARVWSAAHGEPIGHPLQHPREVLWVDLNGDGRSVVTACADGMARIWHTDTGELLVTLPHAAEVLMARFDRRASRVVTCSRDQTARLWDVATGMSVGEPMVHSSTVYFVGYTPDERYILTADKGHRAHLWDSRHGKRLATMDHFFFTHAPEPFPQFNPAVDQVITMRWFHAFLRDGRSNWRALTKLGHESHLSGASYSPDGRYVATISRDATARLWDATTGEPVCGPFKHGNEVHSVQFRSDGQQLITSARDKSVCLWSVADGQRSAEPIRHGERVESARMNLSGRRIVSVPQGNTAWLWDVRVHQPLTAWRYDPAAAAFAKFSHDGRHLLVCDDTDTVRVWDAQSGVVQGKPARHARTQRIANAEFSPDDRLFVTAGDDDRAQIWNASTGDPVGKPLRHGARVRHAEFSPDGKRVVSASEDKRARLWDAETSLQLFEFAHEGDVEMASFSPDGGFIVTASKDGTAQVWSTGNGRRATKPLKHDNAVYWAVFDASGERVATASKDKTARIWSAQSGRMLTPPLAHSDELVAFHLSVSFNRDGTRLVTMAGSSAQIWDTATGRAVTPPLRHHGMMRAAQFSPDGSKVLTAAEDGTARLWDTETGYPVSEVLQGGTRVRRAVFSPDGTCVLVCASDRSLRMWQVTSAPFPVPGWLPDLAEAVVAQRIDDKDVTEVVPVERLFQLRQRLSANREQTYYGRWVRWFFADSATRTISPSSHVTVSDYVARRIGENTTASLREATRLSTTNAVAFARLAQAIVATNRTVRPNEVADAEWFSRYATNLAPNHPEVGQARSQVMEFLQLMRNSPKP